MSESTDFSHLKVVVVDDSDFSRNTITRMLKELGVLVVGEANSAAAALPVVREKKPNVVITDIVMPEISGIELTEQLTQNYDDLSVIVISSLSQEHVILESIGAGASDFLAKPISAPALQDSLSKIAQQLEKE
jgi:YesN/AraC family two-component response regulator